MPLPFSPWNEAHGSRNDSDDPSTKDLGRTVAKGSAG